MLSADLLHAGLHLFQASLTTFGKVVIVLLKRKNPLLSLCIKKKKLHLEFTL